MGFTHIELLPITEHPYDPSWGYQATGYFAPTSRFGSPGRFPLFRRLLPSARHRRASWTGCRPTFPKDAHALARFDGTALYEHDDPRKGEHLDWSTLIFNFGRNEVKNFLLSSALLLAGGIFTSTGCGWTRSPRCSISTTRRKEGEWIPNQYGGRENLEAIDFLRELNTVAHDQHARRADHRRGIHLLAAGDPADLRRRSRLRA